MSKKHSQTMPLKVKNEGRIFAVTLAVSRSRAASLLRNETVAQGVLSVRRMSEEERDSLEDIEGQDFGGMGIPIKTLNQDSYAYLE